MKNIVHFLVNYSVSFFKIFALRRKSENESIFKNQKWENGGKEPAAHPTYDVKFKSY